MGWRENSHTMYWSEKDSLVCSKKTKKQKKTQQQAKIDKESLLIIVTQESRLT